mmetsp:Transcript_26055/g.60813  ORF Transcript_26055/g.60813 Transcript_26055/m.60813 type:complete len:260 (+) Transcript_26055:951-1730(+)
MGDMIAQRWHGSASSIRPRRMKCGGVGRQGVGLSRGNGSQDPIRPEEIIEITSMIRSVPLCIAVVRCCGPQRSYNGIKPAPRSLLVPIAIIGGGIAVQIGNLGLHIGDCSSHLVTTYGLGAAPISVRCGHTSGCRVGQMIPPPQGSAAASGLETGGALHNDRRGRSIVATAVGNPSLLPSAPSAEPPPVGPVSLTVAARTAHVRVAHAPHPRRRRDGGGGDGLGIGSIARPSHGSAAPKPKGVGRVVPPARQECPSHRR